MVRAGDKNTMRGGPLEQRVGALLERGLNRYGVGDLEAAVSEWEHALALDPDCNRAREYIGYVRNNFETLQWRFEHARAALEFSAQQAIPFGLEEVGGGDAVDDLYDSVEISSAETLASRHAPADWMAVDAGWELAADDSRGSADAKIVVDPGGQSAASAGAGVRDTMLLGSVPVPGSDRGSSSGSYAVSKNKRSRDRASKLGGELPFAEDLRVGSDAGRRIGMGRAPGGQEIPRAAPKEDPAGTEEGPRKTLLLGDVIEPGTLRALVENPTGSSLLRAESNDDVDIQETQTFVGSDDAMASIASDIRHSRMLDFDEEYAEMEVTSEYSLSLLDSDPISSGVAPLSLEAAIQKVRSELDYLAPTQESEQAACSRRCSRLVARAEEDGIRGDYLMAIAAVTVAREVVQNGSDSVREQFAAVSSVLLEVCEGCLGGVSAIPEISMSPHEMTTQPLDSRAAFLLSRIDGVSSCDELADISGMDRFETFFQLCRLKLLGILAVEA